MKRTAILLGFMMAVMPFVSQHVGASQIVPLQSGIIDPDDHQDNPTAHLTPFPVSASTVTPYIFIM